MASQTNDQQNLLTKLRDIVVFFVKTFIPIVSSDQLNPPQNLHSIRKKFLPPPFGHRTALGALRVAYVASIAYTHIVERRVLTKRDLYYMCRPLFSNPTTVDRALSCISERMNIRRNDLNIVAAPKGLVAGSLSFTDEHDNYIDVGMFGIQGCLIPSRPERIKFIQTQVDGILVIEKEASFYSLLNEERARERLGSFLTVTGKGYPDHGTCAFLQIICSACRQSGINVPVFLLTDADPHGLCIASCYMRALEGFQVRWIGVRPSDNGKWFQVGSTSLKALTDREKNILDSKIQEWSEKSSENDMAQSLLSEAMVLWRTKVKFEMEALSIDHGTDKISTLLRYLTLRINQDDLSTPTGGPSGEP